MGGSWTAADRALGRLLRTPLRLIPVGTQVRVLRGPLRGRRWIVGSGTHGMWLGTHETHLLREFVGITRDGMVAYDLGANVGVYSLLASGVVGPRGHVVAFEPLPRNLEFLRRHLELNHVTNTTVVPAAVAERAGTGSFDLGLHPSMGHVAEGGALEVPTVALDELVASGSIAAPNVMKLDIEGGELAALLGARRVLDDHRPTILLALHGERIRDACLELLTKASYNVRFISDNPYEVMATPGGPVDG